jgi:hypothetical protein
MAASEKSPASFVRVAEQFQRWMCGRLDVSGIGLDLREKRMCCGQPILVRLAARARLYR